MRIAEERKHKENRTHRWIHRCAAAGGLLITLFLPALFPASGEAHPPQEVLLAYDQTRHTLEVRITHSSKDPATHYVKKVEIKRGDKTIAVTEYQSQPAGPAFTYAYPLETGEDLLDVVVSCSIFGSKNAKLEMKKTAR